MTSARNSTLIRYGVAAVVYLSATALCFHAVLLHPGTRVIGGFSDGTSAMRSYWAAAVQHRNPFTFTHDALLGAPQGTSLAPATTLANGGIQAAFVWELRGPLGLIGAWNAFLLLGFLATALAMFAFLRRLGCSTGASVIGGYVFAFCPYALERAYAGHLAFVQNWVYVLLAGALLAVRRRRALRYGLLVGGVLAVAFYLSAYTGLLASFMTVVFGVVELVRLRTWRDGARTVSLGAVAFGSLAVLLTPIAVLYSGERTAVENATAYGAFDLYDFSARLAAYYVPSPRNPLFHWLAYAHPAGLTEETLFFGYTTLALALAAVLLALRRDAWFLGGDRRRWTVVAFSTIAVGGFLWSLSPSWKIDGVRIPMPSATTELVSSTYRVYSRFGLLSGFGLTLLAAMGLSALAGRSGRLWRLLTPLAALCVVLELLPGNVPALDAAAAPPWVTWLADHPRGIVASYPWIYGGTLTRDTWYQTLDRDPEFDVLQSTRQYDPAQRDEGIRLLARDLFDPLTAKVLATEGVRYVVVHDAAYLAAGYKNPPLARGDYTLLAHPGDVRIFSVHARHVNLDQAFRANVSILDQLQYLVSPGLSYDGGFNAPEQYQGNLSRWMIQDGQIHFDNTSGPMKLTLSGEAFSNQLTRTLELRAPSGRLVAQETIPTTAVPLVLGPFLLAHGDSTFTLVASPGPDVLGPTDPREASIFVEPLVTYYMPSYIPGSCPVTPTGGC